MYEFWLQEMVSFPEANYGNRNAIVFPIAPSEVFIEISGRHEVIDLIDGGEILKKKRPGLKKIKFDAFIPDSPLPFTYYPDYFHDSSYYVDFLKLKSGEINSEELLSNSYLDFSVIRNKEGKQEIERQDRIDANGNKIYTYNVDDYFTMKCVIDSYTIKESAKEGNGIMVSITLKEFRDTSADVLVRKQLSNGAYVYLYEKTRSGAKARSTQYVIKRGDSLWSISKQELGSSDWKPVLYELNQTAIESAAKAQGLSSSSNGAKIFAGTVLQIPQIARG